MTERPEPGLSARCVVTEVVDGDTLTVELRIPARVRLLDCWAPELKEAGGPQSGKHLETIAVGKSGLVVIPFGGASRVDGIFSFGRVLGDVWVDGIPISLAQKQIAAGLASSKKNGELGT